MRKCLVQPNNNIGIDEIAGGADGEGPGTRQNPVKTQPSGGENATLWFGIAADRRDTMLVAVQSGDPEFGKLLTLHAEDRACEGEPRKVPQSLSLFSVSPSAAYRVTGVVNGTITTFVDTGAAVSLLRADMWEKIQSTGALLEPLTNASLVGANGTPIDVM